MVNRIDPELARQINEEHRKLMSAFKVAFTSDAGVKAMEALKGRFINTILPPEATNDQLRYREGQRSIVTFIEQMSHESIPVPYPEHEAANVSTTH